MPEIETQRCNITMEFMPQVQIPNHFSLPLPPEMEEAIPGEIGKMCRRQ